MGRRNIREEAKKPDIVVTTIGSWVSWAKANPKTVFLGGAILILLLASVFGWSVYESRKNERAQYLLSQGLRSYQQFSQAGERDSLLKAESTFKLLLREGRKGLSDVARLYLGKISRAQNRTEEARTYYRQVAQGSQDPLLKRAAAAALQELGGSK